MKKDKLIKLLKQFLNAKHISDAYSSNGYVSALVSFDIEKTP